MILEIIEHPEYAVAHPHEPQCDREPCGMCALAVRPDTGELVLLWLCGGINWSVSRNDPAYRRHRSDIEAGRLHLP